MSEVLTRIEGPVAIVSLNRPDRMNSISHNMLLELSRALLATEDDPEIRVVVLTAIGPAFCAGLDLEDAASEQGIARGGFPVGTKLDLRHFPTSVLYQMDKPVLCAINGGVAGFGIDLALSCDVRFCAADTKIALSHARRGVFPDMGGTWHLPRLLGWSRAAELVFTGRTLSGAEALELRLVDHVVADDDPLGPCLELAREIARCAPLAVQAAKRMMRAGAAEGFGAHVQQSYLQVQLLIETADFREGVAAFLQKRDPIFSGR